MKKTAIALLAAAAMSVGVLLVAPSLAAPATPEPVAMTASLEPAPQDDEVWGCIYTGPLDKKMCVEVTKTFCFRNAVFATGNWYPEETCNDLKARGAY